MMQDPLKAIPLDARPFWRSALKLGRADVKHVKLIPCTSFDEKFWPGHVREWIYDVIPEVFSEISFR